MTIKDRLDAARIARIIVACKQMEIAELETTIASCTSSIDGMPKSHTGNDRLASQVAALVDKRKSLADDIDKLIKAREEADALIKLCEHEHTRVLLTYRYIIGLGWEDIADKMHYTIRHVLRLHGGALLEIEKRCHKMSL